MKCLSDPTEAVRAKCADSLGTLVRLAPRTEPLINELTTNVASNADAAVRLSMAQALGEVLLNVPQPTTEAAQEKILDALVPRIFGGDGDRREREASAWPFAVALRRHMSAERA